MLHKTGLTWFSRQEMEQVLFLYPEPAPGRPSIYPKDWTQTLPDPVQELWTWRDIPRDNESRDSSHA